MSRLNGRQERWCENCGDWFQTDADGIMLVPCPRCGEVPSMARCNRCGHTWRIKKGTYPKNCVACKSPYFCRVRIQDRELVAKRRD